MHPRESGDIRYADRSTLRRCLRALAVTILFVSVGGTAASAQIIRSWEAFSALDRTTSVATTTDASVIVGSQGGAYRLDPATEEVVEWRSGTGLIRLQVSGVGVDPTTEDIYIGSNDGSISILRKGGWWTYLTDIARSDRVDRTIRRFVFDGDRVFVLTSFGVVVVNPADSTVRETWTSFGGFPTGTAVNDIAIVGDSIAIATPLGVAIAVADGRNLADPSQWRTYSTEAMCGAEALSMISDGAMLLVGTSNGVCRYEAGAFTRFGGWGGRVIIRSNGAWKIVAVDRDVFLGTDILSLQSIGNAGQTITDVAVDDEGNGVIGLERGGIVLVSGGGLVPYLPNGPASNNFDDLTFGFDGSLWAATGGDGITRLVDDDWFNYNTTTTPGLTTNSSININVAHDGRIWSASFGDGYFVLSPDADDPSIVTVDHYDERNSPLRGTIDNAEYVIGRDLKYDEEGVDWFLNWDNTSGIRGAVLLAYDGDGAGGQFYSFPASTRFPGFTRTYTRLAIDFDGTKWLAAESQQGLLYFVEGETLDQAGTWGVVTTANGLISNQQTALLVDPDGELWIGTTSGATILVNPFTTSREGAANAIFREVVGVQDAFIRDIAVDALNRKWVGTEEGIFLLSSDGTELLATYTTENSPLVDNRIRSIVIDQAAGDVYIGTPNGLNRISTEAVASQQTDLITAYPQPFIVPSTESLTLRGLPARSSVKILTVDGRLVREIDAPGGDIGFWDGTDQNGEPVPTGIYILAASSDEGDAIGKIAVVRK